MQPIPSRHDSVGGTASLLTIHRAAKIVITGMTGVSKSSAILVPSRGATPSTSDGAKNESHPENASEIEHASFQNLHYGSPAPGAKSHANATAQEASERKIQRTLTRDLDFPCLRLRLDGHLDHTLSPLAKELVRYGDLIQ